jgi:uncharacterized protein
MPSIHSLHIYPVKSCRGIDLPRVEVLAHGLAHDREWMIVDRHGEFLTQREIPSLARITTGLTSTHLYLSVYGRGGVSIPLAHDATRPAIAVKCWGYEGMALDCGVQAADWLSELLEQPVRLVRFAREERRWCNPDWVGQAPLGKQAERAHTLFSDGYCVLVLGMASVADLSQRMGQDVTLDRFRANVIIQGLEPYDEDFVSELSTRMADTAALKLVKLCPRCSVPSVDQQSGEITALDPTAALTQYRFNREVGGAVLGNNAVVQRNGWLERGAELVVQNNF